MSEVKKMIKETLKMMLRGDMSLNEIAQSMGISVDELKIRLDTLEQMRYLTSDNVMGGGNAGGCSHCPSAGSCSVSSNNLGMKISTFQLTEKGMKICGA